MIEVRDLVKTYGPTVAVNGISFEIPRGEVVGFLGPNGAGKTTTMRILTCYLPADSGTARMAGHDVFRESIHVRRRIGYLPESAPVYLEMGIVEYLEWIASMRGLDSGTTSKRIREMVDVCGLTSMIQKNIGQLSKGYRQRVGLAATLIHDPDVLVLDEPTSGLDPNQIIEIRQLIREIGREKTVILSTHILPEVEATCDRVLIINRGEIVASGTPEELTRAAAGEALSRVSLRAPKTEAEPALRALDGVAALAALEPLKEGTCRYEVRTTREDGIEEAVFRLAVDRGWVLTELHSERLSLEQVFTQLTTGER